MRAYHVRLLVLGAFAGTVLVAAYAMGNADETLAFYTAMVRDSGAYGAILVVVAQLVVSATGIFPASVLGVAAGLVYGVEVGAPLAAAGTMLGAVAGYFLGQRGSRHVPLVPSRLLDAARAVKAYLKNDGWRSVALIRLSPVVPFAVTSIAFGAARVPFGSYVVGTAASLPALVAYVYLGDILGATAWDSAELKEVGLLMFALGLVALVAFVGRFIAHRQKAGR